MPTIEPADALAAVGVRPPRRAGPIPRVSPLGRGKTKLTQTVIVERD